MSAQQATSATLLPITKTATSPTQNRNASFSAAKLTRKNSHIMTINISNRCLILLTCLWLASIAAAVSLTINLLQSQALGTVLIPLSASLIFFIFGAFSLYKLSSPIVFNRMHGCFWQGFGGHKHAEPLSRVHCLQVLSYVNHSSGELNLVLTDGSRINLIDHASLDVINIDAQQLAAFLEVPVRH